MPLKITGKRNLIMTKKFLNIAIVTGASSGLGREYVRLLDAENLDELWLCARREKFLRALSNELNTPIKIFSCDLTRDDDLQKIFDVLEYEQPRVKFLINSAGFGKIGGADDIELNDLQRMIDLNCKAAMALTQKILPFMSAGSHVMEICSCAAFQPIPYLNVYAATKAFLLSYSRALAAELAPKKIFVSAVCPYWIKDTEFISVAQDSANSAYIKNFPFASTVKEIAAKSFDAVKAGKVVITPDIISTLHRVITKIFPRVLLMTLSKIFHRC